jgi:hypothetical protein
MKVEVSFVEPGSLSKQTTLAETKWTYGSAHSTMEVRNDFPGFGDAEEGLKAEAASLGVLWSVVKFAIETSAHELGHAAFAALPEEARLAIVEMFGGDSDDEDELSPPGSAWQNRIAEGIAETFKEAFLPRRYRVFPNRTNKRIPYSRFSEFRRLFRSYQTEDGGESGPGWKAMPEADTARIGDFTHRDALGLPTARVGLYDATEWLTIENPSDEHGYVWSSEARSFWMGHANDHLEARQAIKPPDVSYFDPGGEWADFTEGSPSGSWSTSNSWSMQCIVGIRDAAGKLFTMSCGLQILRQSQTKLFSSKEKEEKDEPSIPPPYKWWLQALVRFPFGNEETLSGSSVLALIVENFGVSGEEIFQAAEAKGQTVTRNEDGSDVYEMIATQFFATGSASLLKSVPPRRTFERGPIEDNMLELWARPLEETEEEGIEVEIGVPNPLLEPHGGAGGSRASPRPVSGSRA